MRIAYVTAGAAGMYCGSCLGDAALARALAKLGHEVGLVPTYTPLRTEGPDPSRGRIFYGAINVYLQQKLGLFRRTPRALDRLLDGRLLLGSLERLAGATSAAELGALTLSMLQGERGRQAKELKRLVDYLRDVERPEVVHLTNTLFLGLAEPIRRELRVPLVCSLQGEDLFLDALAEPYRSAVLDELRRNAQHVDRFIAPSRYYAEHMAKLLELDVERLRIVPLGIPLDGHEPPAARPDDAPFAIGYLARVAPEKGFHVAVDAFLRLAREPRLDQLRLDVAGYLGPRDRAYFEAQRRKIEAAGLAARFTYRGALDRAAKLQFLREIDALAVPTLYREAKGRFVLEALASGVPVVVPAHGSFPEMLAATGGGVLVAPDSPEAVADALAALHRDPARRRELGRVGRAAVLREFDSGRMARGVLDVYAELASKAGSG